MPSLWRRTCLIILVWFSFLWQSDLILWSDVQWKSKHTSVKYFCWQAKLVYRNIEINGKENINYFEKFFVGNFIRSYIQNNRSDYFYVNRRRHWVFNYMSEKKHIWFLSSWYFPLSLSRLKPFIQVHNLLLGCAFGSFICVRYENFLSYFSAFSFLT